MALKMPVFCDYSFQLVEKMQIAKLEIIELSVHAHRISWEILIHVVIQNVPDMMNVKIIK